MEALEAREIYERTSYFTEVYRNELARKVRALGYEIEWRKTGWESKGVSPDLLALYSERSGVRDMAVAAEEKRLGRKLNNNERAVILRETRADNLTENGNLHGGSPGGPAGPPFSGGLKTP